MYSAQKLIGLSREHMFNIGPYKVLSQHPDVLAPHVRSHVVPLYLPQFIQLWHDIEQATGHRWKCTSYLRQSPSHSKGHAFDLAPAISPSATKHYAVYNNSDPVLYKRVPLIRQLQTLRNNRYSPDNTIGIFMEPDHLHVQILSNKGVEYPTSVIKWGIPKPIYGDTYERIALPATITGYK